MSIAMIVACAQNNAIGRGNTLPWRLPQDLQYFKRTTLGKPIIMGRKTYESIGRPLPGRANIVITRQSDWPAPEGVQVAADVASAIGLARRALTDSVTEVIIMGGEQIYRAALALTDKIYKTEIDVAVEDADAFFPPLAKEQWRETSRREGDAAAPLRHWFVTLERKTKSTPL